VMALGFCVGPIFRLEPHLRQWLLLKWGTLLIIAFVLLRAVNVYGDPAPWSLQPSATYTLLSFLRTTKYPPSLDFLLMTIGPALLALAWFDRRRLAASNPLVVIGRVPFFYYVTHFWALHLLVALMAWLRYGAAVPLFSPVPSMGGSRDLFPEDFGYPLWLVYIVWIAVVVALYPLCRWFAAVKARRRDWWLSYL